MLGQGWVLVAKAVAVQEQWWWGCPSARRSVSMICAGAGELVRVWGPVERRRGRAPALGAARPHQRETRDPAAGLLC